MRLRTTVLATAVLAAGATMGPPPASAEARNAALVHGLAMDGSGRRAVRALPAADGHRVGVVRTPLTGLGEDAVRMTEYGLVLVDAARFREHVAADVPAGVAHPLVPTSPSVFTDPMPVAAWRTGPSWAAVATPGRAISPDPQRWMHARASAAVTELRAKHLPRESWPEAVAAAIMGAARAAG